MMNIQIATQQNGRLNGGGMLFSIFRSTLFLAPFLFLTVCNSASAANLLFKSDFSKATIEPVYKCGSGTSGGPGVSAVASQCYQKISGGGFPVKFPGWGDIVMSEFQMLSYEYYGITPNTASNYFKNEIQTVTGPDGNPVKALYSWKNTAGQQGYNYGFTQEGGDLYHRFWIKYPSTLPSDFRWTSIFEWKAQSGYRFTTYIYPKSGGGYYYHVQVDNNTLNGTLQKYYTKDDTTAPVPLGRWVLVETWTHRSHGSDGRLAVAINGKIIGDYRGPNYGVGDKRLDRLAVVKNYGTDLNYEWVYGIEDWDAIPCGTFPCGNSATGATVNHSRKASIRNAPALAQPIKGHVHHRPR